MKIFEGSISIYSISLYILYKYTLYTIVDFTPEISELIWTIYHLPSEFIKILYSVNENLIKEHVCSIMVQPCINHE